MLYEVQTLRQDFNFGSFSNVSTHPGDVLQAQHPQTNSLAS